MYNVNKAQSWITPNLLLLNRDKTDILLSSKDLRRWH